MVPRANEWNQIGEEMSTTEPIGLAWRLYVLRHAKSSWKQPELPDFARPLNSRGRRDAPRMGRLIAQEHGLPDLVLCSSARRAVETYWEAAREWDGWPELHADPAFYACRPEAWLDALAGVPDGTGRVMIVGHMPELHEVLSMLVGGEEAPDRFPTAALAVVDSEAPWSRMRAGTCRLASFQVPRDL